MTQQGSSIPYLIRRAVLTGVFISHSSKDSDFAERLAQDIRNAGLDVWISTWKLKVGDSIVERINKALSDSDYFIVILSPDSVQSKWVKLELDSALMKQLSGRKITVLPVLYKFCDIPPLLQLLLYANVPRDGYERVKEQLLTVLRQESASVLEPSTVSAEPCRLWEMSKAELRRRMNGALMVHEVKTLYFDLLGEDVRISDEMEKNDKIMKLLLRLDHSIPSRIPEIINWLVDNRPDLCDAEQQESSRPTFPAPSTNTSADEGHDRERQAECQSIREQLKTLNSQRRELEKQIALGGPFPRPDLIAQRDELERKVNELEQELHRLGRDSDDRKE